MKPTTPTELKPCPFCGSTNLRIGAGMFCDDDGEHEGVECIDCDAINRIEHWNRRAGDERSLVEILNDNNNDNSGIAALTERLNK